MFAALKTTLGIVVLWFVAEGLPPVSPLAAGWLGMIGAVFILHFGTFHLLSLVWRRMGVKCDAGDAQSRALVFAG